MSKESISRRDFLKFSGTCIAATVVSKFPGVNSQGGAIGEDAPVKVKACTVKEEADQINDRTIISKDDTSLLDTVAESAIVTLGRIGVTLGAKKMGIPVLEENKRNVGEVVDKPAKTFVHYTASAPIIEEALCRLLPDWLLHDKSKSDRWDVGALTSLVFGFLHNVQEDEKTSRLGVRKKLPLYQLLGGLYYWKLQRSRGYAHAVTGHATNNVFAFLYLWLNSHNKDRISVPNDKS